MQPTPRSPRPPSSDVGVDPTTQPDERRKQTRKGTRSCWECRRRKVRCKFDDAISRDVCRSCRRRGAACVGQEFSEETSHRKQPTVARDTCGRLDRLELLVGHMLDGESPSGVMTSRSSPVAAAHPHAQAPDYDPCTNDAPVTQELRARPESPGFEAAEGPAHGLTGTRSYRREDQRLSTIARKLVALLPSEQDCLKIHQLGGYASYCYQQIVAGSWSDTWIAPRPGFCEEQAASLKKATHPALLARIMLGMAATLQRVRPPAGSLSECPQAVQKRLADGAISLVCNDDQLMGSVESLECLITQMAYLSNGGNLRLALIVCRRTITMCQLMGLHQPHNNIHVESVQPNRSVDPRLIWFAVVYVERLFCLFLGLPNAARDMNDSGGGEFSALTIGNTPVGQLERTHCVVAARIIRRNEDDPFFRRSRQVTRDMDLELERSAALMPPRWWAIPQLSTKSPDEFEFFLEIHKVSHQLLHNFLLIQLHLPFILRPSSDPENLSSKATCTNASRDALARFVAAGHVRELLIPEASDFFALIAAIALLLVHIDAHRADHGGMDMSLRHQRLTDRALLLDTLEFMRADSSKSSDMLSKKSSDVLRRLLEIEEDAAAGQRYTTSPGPDSTKAQGEKDLDSHRDFHLKIPYFGILVISPDRPVTRAPLGPDYRPFERTTTRDPPPPREQSNLAAWGPDVNSAFASNAEGASAAGTGAEANFVEGAGFFMGEGNSHESAGQLGDGQDIWYPNVSARVEDWAFQGVDAAFFDNIIRGLESPSPRPTSNNAGGG